MRDVNKQVLGVLWFAVTVTVVAGVLALLNWLPGALDPGLMKRYPTVDAATSALGLRKVYVPAYFPQSLGWPPSEVLAQGRPYVAMVMSFTRAGDGETALVISQAASRRFEPDPTIRFHSIGERVTLDLRGRAAQLEAGTCEDRSACSRIQWDEDGMRIMLVMKASSVELIRIAESMLH